MNRRNFIKRGSLFVPAIFVPNLIRAQFNYRDQAFLANATARAVGASGAAFSDDFNRADSTNLGPNWTEASGSWEILSFQLLSTTGGFTRAELPYTGTACNTTNQYVKVTLATGGGTTLHRLLFRYTDASSPYYVVDVDEFNGAIHWLHMTSVGGTETTIDSTSYTPSYPLTVGVTIEGSGNSTVVRVWIGPSGLPSSASSWGGAATYTFSADPSSPVNSGLNVGLGCRGSDDVYFDDFFGGDTP